MKTCLICIALAFVLWNAGALFDHGPYYYGEFGADGLRQVKMDWVRSFELNWISYLLWAAGIVVAFLGMGVLLVAGTRQFLSLREERRQSFDT